jgi:uncharacterized RDD family membrane protein YckC
VGFWLRALATLIDAVLVLILSIVAVVGLDEFVRPRLTFQNINVVGDYVAIAVILNYTAMDVVFHGTLGKFFVGLKIANSDGSAPSAWTLANRWTYKWTFLLLALLSMLLGQVLLASLANLWMFLILLGCLGAMGEAKLTWHDRWAKTAVFHRRDLHPEKSRAGFPVMLAQPMSQDNELLVDSAAADRPSIWDAVGRTASKGSADDINAQVRADRNSWDPE